MPVPGKSQASGIPPAAALVARRSCPRVAARGGALLVALALVGACGGEVARSDLPITDDFSGSCRWSEDNDEHISLDCQEGTYRALFKRTDERVHHVVPRRIAQSVASATVEADVTLRAFPGGSSEDFQAHGVTCLASPEGAPIQGYSFLVAPSVRGIAIVKHDETDASLEEQFYLRALVDEQSGAVPSVGETTRIRGDCRADGEGVELTMYLDGKEVARAHDPSGFAQFEGLGFVVMSTRVGTEIRFDDFKADALDE